MWNSTNRDVIVKAEPRARQATLEWGKLFRACLIALLSFASGARAQTSAFTFQGRLSDNGVPANGSYDMELKLFDTQTVGTGTQIGSTVSSAAVQVTGGVFTVQLDFTAGAFSGADRFLEVGVKPAGSADPFNLLTPRQAITSTPYAVRSATATTADTAINATNATFATAAAGNFNVAGDGTLVGRLSVGQATPNEFPFSVVGKSGAEGAQTSAVFSNDSPDTGVTIQNTTTDGRTWTLFSSGTGSVLDSFPSPTPVPGFGNGAFSIYDVAAKQPRLMIGPSGVVSMPGGLYINTTAGIAVDGETRSGGEAIYGECLQEGNNCYAVEGYAPTGDYAGYFYGGKGVYAESDDAAKSALDANAYGANSYAVHGESAAYRAGYFKSASNGTYSLYVDSKDGPGQGTAALNVRGTIRAEGGLVVAGSKSGYIVDIMQNADSVPLEPGDVVVIAGSAEPVLGQIPVVKVRKAGNANDSGAVGIVDQVWYAPNAEVKAAYEAQETGIRNANAHQARSPAADGGRRSKRVEVAIPEAKIPEDRGVLHALPDVSSAPPGGYVSVVTLGSYKMVKVDSQFGAIHAGDLLTTSTTLGHAMKASPVAVGGAEIYRSGTIVGKALEPLETGKGAIKIFVTLK